MQLRRSAPWARHRGVSLVEVLTAVLVLSVGTLGVAALQGAALRDNREALQRTEAILLAGDILEHARANPPGGYAIALGAGPPSALSCLGADCSPDRLADFDLATWKCRLGTWEKSAACKALWAALLPASSPQAGLPDGDGSVATGDGGIISATVTWRPAGRALQRITVQTGT